VPKKANPARRQSKGVTGDECRVTRKEKAVGRESSRAVTPKPELRNPKFIAPSHFELREDGSIGAPASGTARSKQTPNAVLEAGAPSSTLDPRPSTAFPPHAHPVPPAHFELREDASIGAPASGTARSQQTPNAVLEAGAPSSTLDSRPSTAFPPHAHLIPPAHFELREDGQIVGVSGPGSRLSGTNSLDAKRQTPDPQFQAPDPITPKLVYHDDARKLWLYQGNSLELLDAIAAKYPDGRFDAIFADPPALP